MLSGILSVSVCVVCEDQRLMFVLCLRIHLLCVWRQHLSLARSSPVSPDGQEYTYACFLRIGISSACCHLFFLFFYFFCKCRLWELNSHSLAYKASTFILSHLPKPTLFLMECLGVLPGFTVSVLLLSCYMILGNLINFSNPDFFIYRLE